MKKKIKINALVKLVQKKVHKEDELLLQLELKILEILLLQRLVVIRPLCKREKTIQIKLQLSLYYQRM